jgi:hypothetical protein
VYLVVGVEEPTDGAATDWITAGSQVYVPGVTTRAE